MCQLGAYIITLFLFFCRIYVSAWHIHNYIVVFCWIYVSSWCIHNYIVVFCRIYVSTWCLQWSWLHIQSMVYWSHQRRTYVLNTLTPRTHSCNLKLVILKLISRINILRITCEIACKWIPQHFTDDFIWHRAVQLPPGTVQPFCRTSD